MKGGSLNKDPWVYSRYRVGIPPFVRHFLRAMDFEDAAGRETWPALWALGLEFGVWVQG